MQLELPKKIKPKSLVAIAGLLAALILAVISARAMFKGGDLQHELNRGHALHNASVELAPLVALGGGNLLRDRVRDLVRNSGLGLTYLAVSDSGGNTLAVDGRFESLAIPLISTLAKQRLRSWLYEITSDRGRFSLQQNGQTVGEVDFALAPAYARDVRERALEELRLLAWIGLLVGFLALGVMAYMLTRKPREPDPAILSRSQQEMPPRKRRSADIEAEEIATTLSDHGIHALDTLKRALIVVDRDARIRFMNQTAARITGWSAEDAKGRLVYSVFHPLDEQQSPLVTPAETCLRSGHEYEPAELWVRSRDASVHAVEVMAALLRDGSEKQADGAAMVFHVIDERLNLIDHLRRQARLSIGVIDHLVEGVFTTDTSGVIRFANVRAARMFGYPREQLTGLNVTKMMPVPFLNEPKARLQDYIGGRYQSRLPKVAGWRKDATTFPLELVVQPMSVDGTEGLVVITRDITERQRSDNLSQRLGRLLDSAADEVYIFDAASLFFVEANRGARRNLGLESEKINRLTPLTISRELDEDQFHSYLDRLRSGEIEHVSYRCRHVREDGSEYPVEVRLSFSGEEEPPMFLAIAADITERQSQEDSLRHLAHHDLLTGLPNRATLLDRMGQAVITASRSSRLLGIYCVDIDRFKHINENHGREIGDEVLKIAAARLDALLRDTDTVARIGPDQFAIVAQGLRSVEDGEALARKILEAFALRFEIDIHKLQITPSVGLSLFPLDDSDAEGLLRHADAARSQAKQTGSGRYHLYSIEMSPDKRRQLELERGLGAAIALQQLDVSAEMAVELTPGPAAGRVSAILLDFCWQHLRHGRIGASELQRSAGRAGLVADLELWMIYRACTVLPPPSESDLDLPPVPVVINVSGWQFRDPEFYEQVFELMDRHKVPPRRLVFAVEGGGFDEVRQASAARLRRLRDRGVRIALRDGAKEIFKALDAADGKTLDLILLQPQEVAQAIHDKQTTELLRLAILAAKGLDIPTLAQGIPDESAQQWLVEQGVRLGTGSAFGDPVDADSLSRELNRPRTRAA